MTLREWVAELHAHTVLSPCAAVEMIPPLIVRAALARGIQLLAITDHNASANVAAVQSAAAGTSLVVLPGMELQTREEVHLLCLFDTLAQLAAWQQVVDASLPLLPNKPDFFGEQFVVDATGEFVRREERVLLASTAMRLEEAVNAVHAFDGLAIPAHVDRKVNGLLGVLGLVPPGLAVPALELSRFTSPAAARRQNPPLDGYTLIQNGDAHQLDGFLGVTRLRLAAPTIAELRLALRGAGGRAVRLAAPPADNRQWAR